MAVPPTTTSAYAVAPGPPATAAVAFHPVRMPPAEAEVVLGRLAHAGVAVLPPEKGRHGSCLVAFDELDDAVGRTIQSVADEGVRVLALFTGQSADPRWSWDLLRAGASDVVRWRPGVEDHIRSRLQRWEQVDACLQSDYVRSQLVGTSRAWLRALREAVEAALFTDAPVLITGESGTGKEHVARLIHELDPRPRKADLVVLDCTTIVPSLSGSEFFGHEKGAFTGASSARPGAFELADQGTLFLDEVGELEGSLQAELLRVIQEGTFKRVGGNLWRKSAFRLVCATNRDLAADRDEGRFRDDFFYRIAGTSLHLPALRDRRADIVALFEHFYRQVRPGCAAPGLDEPVGDLLVERDYPGNARDLKSLVLRIAQRHVGDGPITVGDLPESDWPG